MAVRGDKEGTASSRGGAVDAVQRLWQGEAGLPGRLLGVALAPAELAYRTAIRARDVAYRSGLAPTDAPPVPAISVGNITVGGTGKTPMVRWLVERLRRDGWTPGILHGGYAEDEPALHRLWFPDLPVVAERDRLRGAGRAMSLGADLLVLDDAFQHRRMGRDLDIVLVAAEAWTRHPRLLPRGPYREPPAVLRRADLVIVTRRSAGRERAESVGAEVSRVTGRPVARALLDARHWLHGDGTPRQGTPAGPAIGVAGIARPEDFFTQAEAAGAELVEAHAFPDHHTFTMPEAEALRRRAAAGPVVMTAKDAVKLVPLLAGVDIWVLEQMVVFEAGEGRVVRALREVVS